MKVNNWLKRGLALLISMLTLAMVACGPSESDNTDSSSLEQTLTETSVWTTTGNRKILREKDYSKEHDTCNLNISAFREEYESAQIIITSHMDTQYTITLSDLTEVGGSEKLSKDSFTVYHERYITVDTIFDTATLTGTGEYPDALVPYENIVACGENKIAAGQNQGLWITLCPSANQKAGKYSGSFTVTVGTTTYNVPVTVEVLNYTLSKTTHIKNSFMVSWEEVALGEMNSNTDIQESYYEFFLDYRVTLESLPGNEHTMYTAGEDLEEMLDYMVKYSQDERVSYMDIGHTYVTYRYLVPELDNMGEFIYDENGNIAQTQRTITSHYMPLFQIFVRAMLERSLEENVNLFAKAGHYAYYYDEFANYVDGHWKVNANMLLAYRMFQQVAYEYLIQASKANGEYDKLTQEEKLVVDDLEAYLGNITYEYDDALSQSDNPADMQKYDENFGGTISAFYDLIVEKTKMLSQNTTDEEKEIAKANIKRSFDMLTDEQHLVFDKLFAALPANEQTLLTDLMDIEMKAVGPKINSVVSKVNVIPLFTDYDSPDGRAAMKEWANYWFGEDGKLWWYAACTPRAPYPSYHIEDELLSSRILSWMMYHYGIEGNLYWDSAYYRIADTDTTVQDYYQLPNRFPTSNGEGFVCYPGRQYGINGPVGSLRLHSIRDGSEEYELFYALNEMYKAQALTQNKSYDGAIVETLLNFMTRDLYNGVKCSYYDGYLDTFAQARNLLNQLILLAANTETAIERLEIDAGVAKVAFSSKAGNTVKVNGATLEGTVLNGIASYYIEIPFTQARNVFDLAVTNGQSETYGLQLSLGGKTSSVVLAGNNGKLQADDFVTDNATIAIGKQDDKDVWACTMDANEERALVDVDIKALNITVNNTAMTLQVYADKEVEIVLFTKIKGASRSKILTTTLKAGWNNVRLDLTQCSMTEERSLEELRIRVEGVACTLKMASAILEEKEK